MSEDIEDFEAEDEDEDEESDQKTLEVTPSEAARFLGTSRSSVLKQIERGLIKYRKGPKGKLIKMRHLEELKATGILATQGGDTALYEAHTEFTQVALKHVKDMFEPVTAGWSKMGTMYQQVIDSLIARNHTLEETHLSMLQQREAFLTETHKRDLLTKDFESKQKRLDDLIAPLKVAAPQLLEQLGESLGGKKRTAMATLVAKLAASGKLQVLLENDMFLEAEERELLREALQDFLPKDIETTAEEKQRAEGFESSDTNDPPPPQSPPSL